MLDSCLSYDACATALLQAIAGVGIDWTFAEDAVKYGGLPARATAVAVSLGGLLVTALMLGIVSGAALGLILPFCEWYTTPQVSHACMQAGPYFLARAQPRMLYTGCQWIGMSCQRYGA
jgi:hypothetical protein